MSFFKGCALSPSLLFHALFLSPIQTHKVSTIFWRDNQKIVGLVREILCNITPLLNQQTHPEVARQLQGTRSEEGGVGGSPMAGMILSLAYEFHSLTKPSQA